MATPTDPGSLAANATVTTTYLNNHRTYALFNGTNRPRVSLTSSATSVPNNSATALAFTSEDWDTDAFHSNVSNTTRITIPTSTDGVYFVNGAVGFNTHVGTSGVMQLLIYKNGASTALINSTPIVSGVGMYLTVGGLLSLVATDYLELVVLHGFGASDTPDLSKFQATLWGW